MKCLYGGLPHTMMSSLFVVMSNPVLCVALLKRVKHYGTALRKCQSLTSYYRSVKIALQACQTPCNVWYYSCVKFCVVFQTFEALCRYLCVVLLAASASNLVPMLCF